MVSVKYDNLESELIELTPVLRTSLQKDVLQIKKLIKSTDKFRELLKTTCDLSKAEYVIYSAYMAKSMHTSETFVFIDKVGNIVCTASGREMELYNMIQECDNLLKHKDETGRSETDRRSTDRRH